jgi:hypothetical protein
MLVVVKPFFILTALGSWRAMGHVSASEPSRAERRGLKPCDTRQHRSLPPRRVEVWCYETHGSVGALMCTEARSGAMVHVAALELS